MKYLGSKRQRFKGAKGLAIHHFFRHAKPTSHD
jgi:hypothetical protein